MADEFGADIQVGQKLFTLQKLRRNFSKENGFDIQFFFVDKAQQQL